MTDEAFWRHWLNGQGREEWPILGPLRNLYEYHKAAFDYDTRLVEAVLARCTEVESGARNVDHILNGTLLTEIAEQVLERMAGGQAIERIKVSAAKNGDFKYAVA